jgi:hypothetical protein
MNNADKMAWRELLSYHSSEHLREVKKVIDSIIENREEFFK